LPVFDQPSLKASVKFKLKVKAHWLALSNQPVASMETLEESKF